MQYGGQIMPLIRISEAVDLPEGETDKTAVDPQAPLQVVVYVEQGRSVGLVVERILDIVDEEIVLDRMAERAGILGTAVVQKRVTDMLDVQGVVRASHPGFFTGSGQSRSRGVEGEGRTGEQRAVLHFFSRPALFRSARAAARSDPLWRCVWVPLVPQVVRGLINLRRQIVTAIDLRRRLSMTERPASTSSDECCGAHRRWSAQPAGRRNRRCH